MGGSRRVQQFRVGWYRSSGPQAISTTSQPSARRMFR